MTIFRDLMLIHNAVKHDIRNRRDDVDDLAGNVQLIDNQMLLLLAMHNDLIGPMIAKIHNHLRRLLCIPIANMMPRIVNCDYQRIPSQQWQPKVEPQMSMLEMDHIWIEAPNLLKNPIDQLNLLKGLPQSRFIEKLKF